MSKSISARVGTDPIRLGGSEEVRNGVVPGLADVSETMLWSLHNRACEAKRGDGVLDDPGSIRIHRAIDYDFDGRFGEPEGLLAVRAAGIDRAIREWLQHNPDGCVVSLGEGLETQVRRVDNGRVRWLSVDLRDAIQLREHFLPSTGRFRHLSLSALDPAWMDAVEPSSGVFVVAQGLLMYLEPEEVRAFFTGIADRFPRAEMVFDVVPRWFSALTTRGLMKTRSYRLPRMPWGINRNEIEPTLRGWHPDIAKITLLDYVAPRGFPRAMANLINEIPFVRHEVPSLIHVTIGNANPRAVTGSPAVELEIPPVPSVSADLRPAPTTSLKGLQMPMNAHESETHSIAGFFAAVTRNADHSGDVATAAHKVIGKRVALGMAAAFNPLEADHAEFVQIIPEKVEAFTSSSAIMLKHSSRASRMLTRLASDEMTTAFRAVTAMVGCASPLALAEAQGNIARAWFERAASNFLGLGMLALDAQDAALAPIRQTVVANAERLGRRSL
jgi:O-methyltransferase involved in polyketide biosynthesis